jgi:hypothetical protein
MSNQLDNRDALLERVLDRALASYTPSGLVPGLEDRVKARLAKEASGPERRPLFLGWGWAAVAGFAAAVVLTAVLVHLHAHVDSGSVAGGRETPQTAMHSAGPHLAVLPQRFRRAHPVLAAASQQRPRRPTQKQLIAQLMAGGPEAIASLVRAAEEEDQPITLKPIVADPLVIQPIEIAPIDNNSAEAGGSL